MNVCLETIALVFVCIQSPFEFKTYKWLVTENVALGKKTYQHGTYMGWNASRAVDGNFDQDGTYGSCAWAHNNDDVFKTWWNVDLAAFYDVKSIEVFFRTDGNYIFTRKIK